ncbi:MAG: tetratricopeptide repeat protein [Isosphaeraceae bacterium]
MQSNRPGRPPGSLTGRKTLAVVLLLAASLATAWNVARSDALEAGERAYARGDLAGSLQHALDHLDRQPWSRQAALLTARCLSRMDYAEQAEPYFRRAGRLALGDMQLRAYGLARGPHPEHAIPAYQQILEQAPDNVVAMRRLAGVLLSQSDARRCLELAHRLESTPGGEVFGAMLRGTVYHNQENPQLAVAAFERVLELDPQLEQISGTRKLFWTQLYRDLVECGRIEDAGQHLERALAGDQDADLMDELGSLDFLRGDLAAAERCYRQAVEWAPTFYRPHLNLAKLYVQLHRRDDALRELNQARALAPRRHSVVYSLALLYRQLGQTAEAEQVRRELQSMREESSSAPRATGSQWPAYAL